MSHNTLSRNAPSAARLDANRANAQLSTGPTSPEGKAKVSINALKTGLTGRTVLLPTDDLAAYQALLDRLHQHWQPATPDEHALVQALADADWRLLRIPALEAGIYALGMRELAPQFSAIDDEATRNALLQAHVFLTYQRPLNNLSTQEARLRRQREKDTAALRQLQTERHSAERLRLEQAARSYIAAVDQDRSDDWSPEQFGFEFSIEQIESLALQLRPNLFAAWYAEQLEDPGADAEQDGRPLAA